MKKLQLLPGIEPHPQRWESTTLTTAPIPLTVASFRLLYLFSNHLVTIPITFLLICIFYNRISINELWNDLPCLPYLPCHCTCRTVLDKVNTVGTTVLTLEVSTERISMWYLTNSGVSTIVFESNYIPPLTWTHVAIQVREANGSRLQLVQLHF